MFAKSVSACWRRVSSTVHSCDLDALVNHMSCFFSNCVECCSGEWRLSWQGHLLCPKSRWKLNYREVFTLNYMLKIQFGYQNFLLGTVCVCRYSLVSVFIWICVSVCKFVYTCGRIVCLFLFIFPGIALIKDKKYATRLIAWHFERRFPMKVT